MIELFNRSNTIQAILLLLVLYLIISRAKSVYAYFYLRMIVPGPKPNTILGHSIQKWDESMFKILDDFLYQFPRLYSIYYLHFAVIRITDPQLASIIYSTPTRKDELVYSFFNPWLGNSILLSEGSIWKRNRRLLSPVFHHESLIHFIANMNDSVNHMIETINSQINDNNNNQAIDYPTFIHTTTLETILNCICSKSYNLFNSSDPSNERAQKYFVATKSINDMFQIRLTNPMYLFSFIYLRSKHGKTFLHDVSIHKGIMKSFINERKENLSQNSTPDMLDLLIKSRDDQGNGLTEDEMVDELNTFIFAGHDTTSAASTFILYYLATNPSLQEKCRNEVFDVIGCDSDNNITLEDINKMNYLTCFIKESLRLYPPLRWSNKQSSQSIVLDGYTIPSNVTLSIDIGSIHLNPNYWPNPHAFDPERFSKNNEDNIHPFAFIPFSAGYRNCIGQQFAMSELKIITSKLLLNYEISIPGDFKMERIIKVVTQPLNGLPVYFKPLDIQMIPKY